MNVSEYFADFLAKESVDFVFGMSGANIELVFEELQTLGRTRVIVAKNESSAVYMADGYYRASKKPGVVISTSGGGAFNLLPSLAECYSSRIPVVCLVGQPLQASEGLGSFQDSSGKNGSLSAEEIFSQVSVQTHKVCRPEDFPALLGRAWQTAIHFRKPVVILLPKDIQNQPLPDGVTGLPGFRGRVDTQITGSRSLGSYLLSDRPKSTLLILGKSLAISGMKPLALRLSEILDAGVATTPDALDAFDHESRRYLGVTGIMGHEPASAWFKKAERIVFLGTAFAQVSWFSEMNELLKKDVIFINDETRFYPERFCGRNRLHKFVGPLNSLYEDISSLREPVSSFKKESLPDFYRPDDHFRLSEVGTVDGESKELILADAIRTVSDALPENSDIYADAGNTGASAVHFTKLKRNCSFNIALAMGGMGYSFGAAIGSCFASGRQTFVLAGDGSFFIHGLEIHTAVEFNFPILFIIFDNSSHGMCHVRESVFLNRFGTVNRFKSSDISAGLGVMFPEL